MPTGVEVARTLSLRSVLRLIQRAALFAAITVFWGVLVAQVPEALRTQAEQGDSDAQYKLGAVYAEGEGVPQDYVQAHKWLNLAASRASAEEDKDYRDARDSVAEKMTPAQIAEAERLAREWKPRTWDKLKSNAAQ